MQAIIHSRYGPPDVLDLKDIDTPVITDEAVLVRVHAAAVGKGDWLTVQGLPYVARMRYGLPKPKHPVPGFDVAGRTEAVGSNVTRLQSGDAVFGWCDGSFAEYASVPEDQLVLKPSNLTFEQAAAVPISGFAALQALRDTGGVQPGQTVVVIGASGGVGSFAVQLAKAFGAEVTGVCSTKSLEMVRSIGADQVIDYTQEDFTRTGRRYDLILEMAGNRSLADLRRALTPKGTLVLVGGSGGRWFMGTGRTLRAVLVSPFVGQRLRSFLSKPRGADLVVLKDLIDAGKITPVIDRAFPLSETPEAIRYVGERSTTGKPSSPCEGWAAARFTIRCVMLRHRSWVLPSSAGPLTTAELRSLASRRQRGKENEHGEGPHRPRRLARRVHQWPERRR
jgi:NADPH:quinone reductase-like Zn-dependent oxidoreductase